MFGLIFNASDISKCCIEKPSGSKRGSKRGSNESFWYNDVEGMLLIKTSYYFEIHIGTQILWKNVSINLLSRSLFLLVSVIKIFLWKSNDCIVVLLEELDMHFHSDWASSNQLQGHFTSDVNYSRPISSINLLFFHLYFFLVNVSTGNNGLKDIAWSQSWFSICNLCLWGGELAFQLFQWDLKRI